jgi:hypothetical protein
MALQLLGSPIRDDEAWRFYGAIYLKAIGNVLPNCHFTKMQLKLLQSIMHGVILPKCGYNRKTTGEIIHGLSKLCGDHFLQLYTMQECSLMGKEILAIQSVEHQDQSNWYEARMRGE